MIYDSAMETVSLVLLAFSILGNIFHVLKSHKRKKTIDKIGAVIDAVNGDDNCHAVKNNVAHIITQSRKKSSFYV